MGKALGEEMHAALDQAIKGRVGNSQLLRCALVLEAALEVAEASVH